MDLHLTMLEELVEGEDAQAHDSFIASSIPELSYNIFPKPRRPTRPYVVTALPTRQIHPTAKFGDLPAETLSTILGHLKADFESSREKEEKKTQSADREERNKPYTNALLGLMTLSHAHNHVAGIELYSRLSFTDAKQGALEIKSDRKLSYLLHSEVISLDTHCVWECSGQDFAKQKNLPPIKVRNVHMQLDGLSRHCNHHKNKVCNPFACLLSRRFLPRTLVVWMTPPESISMEYPEYESGPANAFVSGPWNVTSADTYHPNLIETLVVHLGKPSDWLDTVNDLNQKTWFQPFVRTKSVVFMIDDDSNYTSPRDLDRYDLDMRYNPADNLHPWISRLTDSLVEFCLDPKYAKDITVVNMGVVRSDKLGLRAKWNKTPTLNFCERCFTENEYKEILQAKYDLASKLHIEKGGPELEKANIKFMSMLEYIQTREWKDHLAVGGEAAYLRPNLEDAFWCHGRNLAPVVCPKCGHTTLVDIDPDPYIYDPPESRHVYNREGSHNGVLNRPGNGWY